MIRFDPNRGQFVLQLPCKISFETVNAFGQLVDELADNIALENPASAGLPVALSALMVALTLALVRP